MKISIVGGRLIDPANHIDAPLDLHIAGERIVAVGDAPAGFVATRVIDARGQVVIPGLVDIAASLREPGYTAKGTLESETRAAARGGITTLVCTPDTDPVIDTPADIEFIHRMARKLQQARVLTAAALTHNLEGRQLSSMAALKGAGCVALSNARAPLAWEVLHPVPFGGATEEQRRSMSECEQELWADVQPEFAAIHELRSDLPVECVTLTLPTSGSSAS